MNILSACISVYYLFLITETSLHPYLGWTFTSVIKAKAPHQSSSMLLAAKQSRSHTCHHLCTVNTPLFSLYKIFFSCSRHISQM